MTEEDFLKECPVCQVNCNCKSCLRLEIPVAVSFRSHSSIVYVGFWHLTLS